MPNWPQLVLPCDLDCPDEHLILEESQPALLLQANGIQRRVAAG